MSFLDTCMKYRVFGNSTFVGSEWLIGETWFYVAYDLTCFDQNGYAICDFSEDNPSHVQLTPYIIENYLIEVVGV